ncbi:MAG TPA: APC family permease [Candidatus Baltobacteraceae bacterium]|jgi:amino acid transporter|nr:APC family permease [Candidatus Baltobacteraceae bacterium]
MQRAIGLRGAVAINVITMIGIGPLITIPLVLSALGGPLALTAWIAGAVLALCDGLVWAELASRLPGSGGTYAYLRAAFGEHRMGRAMAFLFNWQCLLFYPCLLATGYIGTVNYSAYVAPVFASNALARDTLAVGIGLLTIGLLYRKTSEVAALGKVLGIAAAATLVVVTAAAFSHSHAVNAFALEKPFRFDTAFVAGFSTGLYIAMYDYTGYSTVALVGDEVEQPNRTIPLSILLAVLVVATLYILLQIGVLGAVPWHLLLDAHGNPTPQSQYIGSTIVEAAWGHPIALGATILVLVTALASLYGNLLGASRIPYAAARDGAFIPAFGKLHPTKDFPFVSLLAIGGLSLVASFFTLDLAIAVLTAGIVLIQGIAQIVALTVLRRTRGPAPFRMPLYPLPALVALAGWILAFVFTGPTAISFAVAWLVVGIVVFLVVAKIERWWPFAQPMS